MRSYRRNFGVAVVALLCVSVAATSAFSADHRDAPLILGNEQQDINDIYAFQSPSNPNNVVFVLTVNPFIGTFAQDGTLDPNTVYEFQIDTNGDALEDIVYTFFFSTPNLSGQQNFILQSGRSTLARGRTGQKVSVSGGGFVQVSIHDDPFFFDNRVLSTGQTGVDAFAGANITAMILEVPRRNLRVNNIGVWAITEVQGRQVDRVGRPGINTVLITNPNRKNDFNVGAPENDLANFGAEVEARITALSNAGNAAALTPILLPDILTIDISNPAGFLNGRGLADDVIDAELNLLSAGAVVTDGVPGNDINGGVFLNTFPYLLPPQ